MVRVLWESDFLGGLLSQKLDEESEARRGWRASERGLSCRRHSPAKSGSRGYRLRRLWWDTGMKLEALDPAVRTPRCSVPGCIFLDVFI